MKINEPGKGCATHLRPSSEPLAWAGQDGRPPSFDPNVLSDQRTHMGSCSSRQLPSATKCTAFPMLPLVCFVGWKDMLGLSPADGKIAVSKAVDRHHQSFPEFRKGGLFWAWPIKSTKGEGTSHLSQQRLFCLGSVRPWATSNTEGCLVFALTAFRTHLHSGTFHPLLQLSVYRIASPSSL